jgi:hypothetical protein
VQFFGSRAQPLILALSNNQPSQGVYVNSSQSFLAVISRSSLREMGYEVILLVAIRPQLTHKSRLDKREVFSQTPANNLTCNKPDMTALPSFFIERQSNGTS